MDFLHINLFQGILILLFLFAILDLMVGVANDAVNFLNSAIGSKVASWKTILIVASIGILVGTLFSNGMMEVARKGIFNPGSFAYSEIMIIFLAVVVTDILLLDFYNTLRLPTSTTVSLVFELLGAATAIAAIKIIYAGGVFGDLSTYINIKGASDIATSILLSVGISFSVGLIVQYIARFIFTYDYTSRLPRFGGIFGGIAITVITYFLLIKGVKDSTLINEIQYNRIQQHTWTVIGLLLVGWSLLLHLGQKIWKWNIPKIIVLIGTFSLAAAFAGNDLVNFIGVSMAGLNSYQIFNASGATDASTFMMDGLAKKVPTQLLLLVLSGVVMIITLWMSRKARGVTDTEISLTKETTGQERYTPGFFSRMLVRSAVKSQKFFSQMIPTKVVGIIEQRFTATRQEYEDHKTKPAFDLIRASVNLTVASILIAMATSMKLPLSTTYVTFMVAMGTALADGVRGRESAVYRVSGVLTIIGGWFMTAFSAFFFTGIVAAFLRFGGKVAIGILVALTIFFLYKTHVYHKKHDKKKEDARNLYHQQSTDSDLGETFSTHLQSLIKKISPNYIHIMEHIISNEDSALKKDAQQAAHTADETKILKSSIHNTFLSLPEEALEHGELYTQAVDYLRKCGTSVEAIALQARDYALNQHPDLIETQQAEIKELLEHMEGAFGKVHDVFEKKSFAVENDTLKELFDQYIVHISSLKINQLQRIKSNTLGVRNTMLYFTLLDESGNLFLYLRKLIELGKKLTNN